MAPDAPLWQIAVVSGGTVALATFLRWLLRKPKQGRGGPPATEAECRQAVAEALSHKPNSLRAVREGIGQQEMPPKRTGDGKRTGSKP